MCFYYLLLGHLLGDFTFQTDKIAINKPIYIKWNILHSAIVTACMLLLSLPFGRFIMLLVLLNGIFHYFIDYTKSQIHVKNNFYSLLFIFIDQALHILIIYFISKADSNCDSLLPLNSYLIKFAIVLVIVIWTSAIIIQYLLRILFNIKDNRFFTETEKEIGNMTRIAIFSIIYAFLNYNKLILLLIPIYISGLIWYYKKKCKWMKRKYFIVKTIFDCTAAIICFLLL